MDAECWAEAAQKSASSYGMLSRLRLAIGSLGEPADLADARKIISAMDGQSSISSRKFSSSMISFMCCMKKSMQYSFRYAAWNFSAAHRKRPMLLTESTSLAATSQLCLRGRSKYCSASVSRSTSC